MPGPILARDAKALSWLPPLGEPAATDLRVPRPALGGSRPGGGACVGSAIGYAGLILSARDAYVSGIFGSLAIVLRVGGEDDHPWFLVPECGGFGVVGQPRSFERPQLRCALGLVGPW